MKIAKDCIVTISYELTNDKGELMDRSPDDEPLVYLHGAAGVLPVLENELEGKSAGEEFDLTVPPGDGFGDHQALLVRTIPKSVFPDPSAVAVGMQVTVNTDEGQKQVTVTAFDDETVTIDSNHPLAGVTLRFKGSVVDVRAATEEELAHWPNPAPGSA